ncbi:TlpA disulfide reductase family protein [Bacteroides sp. 51]|uniref:TlpA family protein disulfide reductase n=1 Tax=Bacteroides sp. 51 TaxID=2302938 RepID=UPI0013D0A428|nr:TlpA disulfide reductase family protein [Bacteroides sp. 51]NDV84143.1 hypothetical protein [Bacteroides sp. 51]
MKRSLFLSLFLISVLALSAKDRVIENPHFSVSTHGNVIVTKITLAKDATLLNMEIGHSPRSWIRIDSKTYIQVDDKKYIVDSAEGIELDKEVFSDETNKTSFVLKFPAIDPKAKTLDFIESDCESCFKIWGLNLDPKTPSVFDEVPESIKNLAVIKDDGKSLETPILKQGVGVLKGTLLGYKPGMDFKVQIFVNNPLTAAQEELETQVENDGSFKIDVPLVTTMEVLLRFSSYNKYILLSPGKESSVYVDLHQKSYQETSNKALRISNSKYIFWDGENADINNQMEDIDLPKIIRHAFFSDKKYSDILGMDALQYKAYILKALNEAIESLSDKKLTNKAREFAIISLKNSADYTLFYGKYDLEQAYRKANNLSYEDKLIGFVRPEFDLDYYSFLKELDFNNPMNLYSEHYGFNVRASTYIRVDSEEVSQLGPEFFQQLINTGNLTPEEKEAAEYSIANFPENWSNERINIYKKVKVKFSQMLIDSLNLQDGGLQLANLIIDVCKDPGSGIMDVINNERKLTMELFQNNLVTREQWMSFNKMYESELQVEDTLAPEERQKRMLAFHEKFGDEMKAYMEALSFKTATSRLSGILGTAEGTVFDLATVQNACRKFEEYTPLTTYDIEALKQIKNPFYLQYALERNNALLAELERNKGKKGFTIHDTPQTEGEQLFQDIVKPFEGKVILIDFWATWCGPCRSAMKQFESAKNELKEKGVVFIYLTDESSPQGTWENMISNISGEHFRMTSSQSNALHKKFGVKGIPSYLILNKKGEQVYFKVGFEGSDRLSQMLNDELNK